MGFSASEAEPFTQARQPELAEQAKARRCRHAHLLLVLRIQAL